MDPILDIVFRGADWCLTATQDGVELIEAGKARVDLEHHVDALYRAFAFEPAIYLNGVLSALHVGEELDAPTVAKWVGVRFEAHTPIAA